MRIIRSLSVMGGWSRTLLKEGVRIGFVPTMGALHEGHRALIRTARLSSDAVVVSIFVNPTQFGPHEDLARYPRQLRQDATLCRQEDIDVLFAPSAEAMYPIGFQSSVVVEGVSRRWEGEQRPTHFSGVAAVVMKLLNIICPDAAFFGQKDYQQVAVVRQLVTDFNSGTRIVCCPTVREADGLAMSSRNVYLTPNQRLAAPVLYQALQIGAAMIRAGCTDTSRLRRTMLTTLARQPSIQVEYMAVADPMTLEPLTRVRSRAVLLGAIRIGSIRLIDNILATIRKRGTRRSR